LADLGQIPADQDPTRLPELGLARVDTSTRDLASRLGYPFRAGVVVLETIPDSPFAPVPAGTVITEVAGFPVASADQMLDVLREFQLLARGVFGAAFTPSGEQVAVQFTVSR
jgi:S1-C subfamily serine protease